jgi:hypothetical protein
VALRIVRQRQQAEDVVHDAFVNIWSPCGQLRRQPRLRPRLDLQRGAQPGAERRAPTARAK